MGLVIENNTLKSSDYMAIRSDVYFQKYKQEDVDISLRNSLFTVNVKDNGNTVAMGRIVGDDKTTFIIKDVVVDRAYRSAGLGKTVMKELMNYIKLKGCDKAYIGLFSTPNKEEFYEQFGFVKRPTSMYGHGMIKYLKKEQ